LNELDIPRLARLGARERIVEHIAEIRTLLRTFSGIENELDDTAKQFTAALVSGSKTRQVSKPNHTQAPSSNKRRRPAMSAAARKEVSERMKRYWAARRKTNGRASARA
jgi:hypothetical protein